MKRKDIVKTIFYVITGLSLTVISIVLGRMDWGNITLDNIEQEFWSCWKLFGRPGVTQYTPITFMIVFGTVALVWLWNNNDGKNYMPGEEFGTAKLVHPNVINRVTEDKKNPQNNKILSERVRLRYGLQNVNNNMIVIGGSGAGKTFYMVKPNAFNAYGSMVATDPKGELYQSCGPYLKMRGYKVIVLDLINFDNSDHYNPFLYLRSDEDIIRLVTNFIANTTPKDASKGDPFWEHSESMFWMALVYYVWYEAPKQGKTPSFRMVMELLSEARVMAKQEQKSPLDIRMEALPENHPARVAYHKVTGGAADTVRSIFISANSRAAYLQNPKILNILDSDDMNFHEFGEGVYNNPDKKVALFLKIPDNDTSYNFIVGMLYTQMFQELERLADEKHGGKLPIHVGYWMDEFSNIALPNNFLKVLATMRSRNMSANIIIQNIAQIKALFKDDWESLTGNCDVLVYLGGNELGTHEYISKLLGKWTIDKKTTGETRGSHGSSSRNYDVIGRELMTPDEVRKMDNSQCLVFIKGMDAVLDDKYHTWEKPEFTEAAIAEKFIGNKEMEIMEKNGQFRFYIDCIGDRGQEESLIHQVEDYFCVFEESECYKMVSENEVDDHYFYIKLTYNPEKKPETVVCPAFSKEKEVIVAAGEEMNAHHITGYFKKKDPSGNFENDNLEYVPLEREKLKDMISSSHRHLVRNVNDKKKTMYN